MYFLFISNLYVFESYRYYSVTNSTGATQRFSANHKTSSEQKNQSSFISDQSQMRVKSKEMWKWLRRHTSIYGEILFIYITEKASEYFQNGGPKKLNKQTKDRN